MPRLAAILRITVLVAALFGTGARLILSIPGDLGWQTLLYFTVQSNIMVCLFLVADSRAGLAGKEPGGGSGKRMAAIHGAVLLYITITGLVYNLMLASTHQVDGLNRIIVQVNHSLTPALFLADWLVRQNRYRYTGRLILPWLVYPIAYFLFGSIEGAVSGSFRYPFLNFIEPTFGTYLPGMVIVVALFAALAWGIIAVNRRTTRRSAEG